MRKTWKKLLAMGLALGMVLDSSAVTIIKELTVQAAETNIAEGTINEEYGQITWVIDSEGHLTVNGTGDVTRDDYGNMPWYEYREEIKTAEINVTGMSHAGDLFSGCSNLTSVDVSGLDTSEVTSMRRMFDGCSSLTELNVSGFDTSQVTDMSYMFVGCSNLTSVDVSGFDTSQVRYMTSMFDDCSNLTSIDVSGFATNEVTDMSYMFNRCSSLTELNVSGFDTSNVTYMSDMFNRCSSLTELNVSGFDTSQVTEMEGMFSDCNSLTSIDVSGLDTSKVMGMSNMFNGCSNLTKLDLNAFDVSNTIYMDSMFEDCDNLTEIQTPKNCRCEVSLNRRWSMPDGNRITTLPQNLSESITIVIFDNVKWKLDENGHLTVSGTGDVTRDIQGYVPWYEYREEIKTAEVDVTEMTNARYLFWGCSNLTSVNVSGFDTSQVTDMSLMFRSCKNLTELDLSGFDTSQVTDMSRMFNGCSNLTSVDVSGFDTSQVTSMASMFQECTELKKLNLSNFDFSCVKNMEKMFYDCQSLSEWGEWDLVVSLETNIKNMFDGCRMRKTPIYVGVISGTVETNKGQIIWELDSNGLLTVNGAGDWPVKNEPNKEENLVMPWGDYLDKIKRAEINLTDVTSLSQMFRGCAKLNSVDLSGLDTSQVTDMSGMFSGCNRLASIDVSGFDTSQVTNMSGMFKRCSSLTELNVSGFDTSQVTDMSYMFEFCSNLMSIDLTSFEFFNVIHMEYMFAQCKSLKEIKVDKVEFKNPVSNYGMYFGCQKLEEWPIVVPVSGSVSLKDNEKIDWEIDENGLLTINGKGEIGDQVSYEWGAYSKQIKAAEVNWTDVTDLRGIFAQCKNLKTVNLRGLDTSQVTKMSNMFSDCNSLTNIDVSGFDTSQVTSMGGMFSGCSSLTSIDVSGFDTSQVTVMSGMFLGCSSLLSIDVSGFDTSQVTDMGGMFYGCTSLTELNVSGFDTSRVTDMGGMFFECTGLQKLDLKNFNTSSTESFNFMFKDCSSLKELDISNFDTSSARDMGAMFFGCSSLETLDVSSFKTGHIENMYDMFANCSSLTELDLSNFDMSSYDSTYYIYEYEEVVYGMLGGCTNLVTLKTPVNVQEISCVYLPCEQENDKWYGPDGKEYISVPKRVPYSITLTKNKNVTEENGITFEYEENGNKMITITGYSVNQDKPIALSVGTTVFGASDSIKSTKNVINLVIPEEIDDMKVVAIKENAFADSSEIVSVIIPATVEKIGPSAFENCSQLSMVIVGENIKHVGANVFKDCKNMEFISFEKNIPEVGQNAFENVSAKVYCQTEILSKTENVEKKLGTTTEIVSFEKYPVASVCTDINVGAWYIEYVQDVYDRELMTGSNGSFKPNDSVTRAQFITTLYRLAGEPGVDDYRACDVFPDVKRDKYYTNAVCWAYNEGITTGSNGKFNTTGQLSRQQLATFVFRFAEVMNYDVTAKGDYSSMKNAEKVSDYAKTAIQWAIGSGLISGSKTTDQNGNQIYDLNPEGKTTRAQLSAILERFCVENKIITKKSGI